MASISKCERNLVANLSTKVVDLNELILHASKVYRKLAVQMPATSGRNINS